MEVALFLWTAACVPVKQGQFQEAEVKSVRGNIYEWTFHSAVIEINVESSFPVTSPADKFQLTEG